MLVPTNPVLDYFGVSQPDEHFRLDPEFLRQYDGRRPDFGFNGLGEFVFYRTYSRVMADGRKETFQDVLKRVVEGCYEIQRRYARKIHIPFCLKKAQASAQEMFQLMWDFKFLPPGRGLWMMGTDFMWNRGGAALNNCAMVSCADLAQDPAEPFCFMMDMSMLGVGVGFDTKGAGQLLIRAPHQDTGYTYQIPDSREGWVDALRQLILSYTSQSHLGRVSFDTSLIRPAGTPIKGFGGTASGPSILVDLLQEVQKLLDGYVGRTLDSVGIGDLMNLIGRCVVAGNVRRSSQLILGEADDHAYREMKNPTAGLLPEDLDIWYKITGLLFRYKITQAQPAHFDATFIAWAAQDVESGKADSTKLREYLETDWSQYEHDRLVIPQERLLPAIETWNALNHHRWASNNSVLGEVGMDYDQIAQSIAVNGEPGVLWLHNIQDYGRMADGFRPGIDGKAAGTNPCFSGEMQLLTVAGPRSMQQLWEEGGRQEYRGIHDPLRQYGTLPIINHRGCCNASQVYRTSESAAIYRVLLSDGSHIDATAQHEFIVQLPDGSERRKQLRVLLPGDLIPKFEGPPSQVLSHQYLCHGPTFCLTEPGDNRVVVQGHHIGQCSEQTLESCELCCLVESFPAHHESAQDYMRTLKFAYLYAKTVTLLPTHNARTNAVLLRNRRIGLSQSGIVQAFAKFGRRQVLQDFCDQGYKEVRRWDRIYSDWLCIPTSIKVTSIKPSGSVSLVAGATPGIHYPEAKNYWRRVRINKGSLLVWLFARAGYHVEPALNDPENTAIITFGVSDERVPATTEVSIWEQCANLVAYQKYWADNQVSCTIKFQSHEANQIKPVLEAFEDELKSISFLPHSGHGYQQAPYEPCTKQEVERYNSSLLPVDLSAYLDEAVGTVFCDGDSCTI